MTMQTKWAVGCLLSTVAIAGVLVAAEGARPSVGSKAAAFELADVSGTKHTLQGALDQGPVVLMVLRGFPGYQCPVCNRQVGQYLAAAEKFRAKNATVLMVYPGPSQELEKRASEFISGKTLPAGFHLLIDPDYTFTNAYGLRWDAPRETAYPATFVIGKDGKVVYANISMSHGGRAAADEVLKAVP